MKTISKAPPLYTFEFTESVFVPKPNHKTIRGVKFATLIIWLLLTLRALIFGGGLFGGLSGIAAVIIIAVSLKLIFTSAATQITMPAEIKFYEDFLEVYSSAFDFKYNERVDLYTFKYRDITKCEYRTRKKDVSFYGKHDLDIYYRKSDDLDVSQAVPDEHKTLTDSRCRISPTEIGNAEYRENFIAIINEYSPLHVTVVNK